MASTEPPLGRLIYMRRFILLAAHHYSSPVARSSSSPCSLFPYAFPCVSFVVSSLVSSLVSPCVSPCVSFRAFRCVVSSVGSSCRLVSLVVSYGRRFVLLFARSRFACRGGLCLAFPCRLVFALVSRLVVASRLSSRLLISFPPAISSSACPWAARVRSRVWFPCSRRSVLLVARSCSPIRSRFMSSVVGRGCVVMAMGRRGLLLSVHPFARCGMDLRGGWGMRHGAPFHVARRSFLVCSCPIVLIILSVPLVLITFSHPLIHEARKPVAETEAKSDEDKTGTRKQQDGYRRDA